MTAPESYFAEGVSEPDERPISDLERFCLAIAAQIEGEPCPRCDGTNHGVSTAHDVCLVCGGSGKAPPEVCEGKLVELCPYCKGREPGGDPRLMDKTQCPYCPCEKCGGSGDDPHYTGYWNCSVCKGRGKGSGKMVRKIYTCPILLIAATYLEEELHEYGEAGRPELLRGMRILQAPNGTWWGLSAGTPVDNRDTLADAARELLRRGLAELTVECPRRLMALMPLVTVRCLLENCPDCSGRGWLPARVERCKACENHPGLARSPQLTSAETRELLDYTGTVDLRVPKCPDCQGRKWVKVHLRATARS